MVRRPWLTIRCTRTGRSSSEDSYRAASALPTYRRSLILVTAHAAYRELSFESMAARGVRIIVDGRNTWRKEDVEAAGILYVGMGRPESGTPTAHRVTDCAIA